MEDPKFMLKLLVGLFAIAFVFSFFGSIGNHDSSSAEVVDVSAGSSVTGLSVFGKLSNIFSNPKSLITGKVVGAQCQTNADCSIPNEFCNATFIQGRREAKCDNTGCGDSDSGFEPLMWGNTSANYYDEWNNVRYESIVDRCNDRATLNESICSNGRVSVQVASCPEGKQCQVGQCVDQILRAGESNPCEINEDCQEGLVCRKAFYTFIGRDITTFTGRDICGQPLEDNAYCTTNQECRSGSCYKQYGPDSLGRCAAIVQPQGGDGQASCENTAERFRVVNQTGSWETNKMWEVNACVRGGYMQFGCDGANSLAPVWVLHQEGSSCVILLGGEGQVCRADGTCNDGLACQNNLCSVPLVAEGGACVDSDGGQNIQVRGNLTIDYHNGTIESGLRSEYCSMGDVAESFCDVNSPTGMNVNILPCPQGTTCQNGACVAPAPVSCTDSDGGQNIQVRGNLTIDYHNGTIESGLRSEYCSMGDVAESFCDVNSPTGMNVNILPCPQGTQCSNGACVQLKVNGQNCVANPECQSGNCKIDRRNVANNKCVECLANNACAGRQDGKVLCKISSNTCVVCTNNSHCARRADGATQCNTRTNVCEQPPRGGNNQACRPEGDAAGRCNNNLACLNNICRPVGGANQACRVAEPKCNVGLECRANKCTLVGGLNQACKSNNTCNANLACNAQKICKKANGQSCTAPAQCLSNKCLGIPKTCKP